MNENSCEFYRKIYLNVKSCELLLKFHVFFFWKKFQDIANFCTWIITRQISFLRAIDIEFSSTHLSKSYLKKRNIFRPWNRLDPQSRQASWLGKLDFCGGRWIVLRFGSAFVSKPQSHAFFFLLSKRDHDSFEDLKSIFPPCPSTLYIYHNHKILLSENNFLRQFS